MTILVVPQKEHFNACGINVSSDVADKVGGNPLEIKLFKPTELKDLYSYSIQNGRPREKVGGIKNVIRIRVGQSWEDLEIKFGLCGDAGGKVPTHAQLIHKQRSKAVAAFAGEVLIDENGKIIAVNNQSGDFKMSSCTLFFLMQSLIEGNYSDIFADQITVTRLMRRGRGLDYEDPRSETYTKNELIQMLNKMPTTKNVKSYILQAYKDDIADANEDNYKYNQRRGSMLSIFGDDGLTRHSTWNRRMTVTLEQLSNHDEWEAIEGINARYSNENMNKYLLISKAIVDAYQNTKPEHRNQARLNIISIHEDFFRKQGKDEILASMQRELRKIDKDDKISKNSSNVNLEFKNTTTNKTKCC